MSHDDDAAPSCAVGREVLRHNPLNAVTDVVERVRRADGSTLVHKRLRAPVGTEDVGSWAGSRDPRHWNSWRREADAYRDAALRRSLEGTGLDMASANVDGGEAADTTADLWLEDVAGTLGTAFTLDDHVALARGLGRWQAAGPFEAPWTSRRWLRQYSTTKPAPWHLLDDDEAWKAPLVRSWPAGLREGWSALVASREHLLGVVEALPRTRSHLDVWVANEIRRPDGRVVLLDWAFAGDGAVGEDLGNHVPDATFDLFWPAEDLAALEAACFEAYLAGLRDAGWRGQETEVRLGVVASCVKYAWLLPRVLGAAREREHAAYHEAADPEHLYQQRGLAFAHLVGWCDEALDLVDRR